MQQTTAHRLPEILHELEITIARAELALCHRRLQIIWGRITRAGLLDEPRALRPYHLAIQALCVPGRCTYTIAERIDDAEAVLDRIAPNA